MDFKLSQSAGPIGVFDSGYGGLTILKGIRKQLPEYDYIYLGDNARAPYGSRSFDIVYQFTLQAVRKLFSMGCQLVILGCNTASAKALRTIQQNDLPQIDPRRRVLGVIRPTAEFVGKLTQTKQIGILATLGTIKSESYNMEIKKLWPDVEVTGVACPLWVPIVENNEATSDGADYFVKKSIDQILCSAPNIDTLVLACTHYPILMPKILQYIPDNIRIVSQGEYVASSLKDYLLRHKEMDNLCTKKGTMRYFTTENADKFKETARIFLEEDMEVQRVKLE